MLSKYFLKERRKKGGTGWGKEREKRKGMRGDRREGGK